MVRAGNKLPQKPQELNIDKSTEAYIQIKVLKMTLESLSMETRRGYTFKSELQKEDH
jgi:hypothetical protein